MQSFVFSGKEEKATAAFITPAGPDHSVELFPVKKKRDGAACCRRAGARLTSAFFRVSLL